MFKQKKYLAFLVAAVMFAASFAAPLPVKAAAGGGIPISATLAPSSTAISAGQSIQVRVTSTVAVNSVIATFDNKTAVGTVQPSTDSTAKEWLVVIDPVASQTVTFYVGASTDPNNLSTTYYLPVTVTGSGAPAASAPSTTTQVTNAFDPNSYNPNAYNSYNPNSYNSYTPPRPAATPAPTPEPVADIAISNVTETSVGRTVTLTVTAGAEANNVWVNFDRDVAAGGKYVQGVRNADNTWSVRFNPADTQPVEADVQTVVIYSNTAYKTNNAESMDYTIAFTSSIAPPAVPLIYNFTSNKNYVERNNESVNFTITTNGDTDNVWIIYNNGQRANANLQSNPSSATKVWNATVTLNTTSSQTITAYANIGAADAGAVSRSYTMNYRDYSNRATISSVDADWEDDEDDYRDGDNEDIHVTVDTNSYANYVWFRYDGHDYNLTRSSSTSNRWTTSSGGRSVEYNDNVSRITVYASEYSNNSYDDSETVTIGSNSSSRRNGDITSVSYSPRNPDVSDNDITFTIKTDSDVEAVEIEDEDGRTDSESDSSGDTSWTLSLDLPNNGESNFRYTIRAYTSTSRTSSNRSDTYTVDVDIDD